MPEYSEAVEISRYGSQDVHTHTLITVRVVNVMGIFQQLREESALTIRFAEQQVVFKECVHVPVGVS